MAGTLELEQGVPFPHVRLQIFGRGGVGKSSTINAMCGKAMEADLASTAGAQLPLLQIRRQALAFGCDASVLCKYDPEPGTKEESLALAAHAAAVLQGAPQVTGQSMLAKAAAQEEEAAQKTAQVVEVAETSKPAKAVQAEEVAEAKALPVEARAPPAAAAPEPTAASSTSGKSDSTPASPLLRPPTSAHTAKAPPAQAPPRVVDPKMVIEYREGKRKQELVLHVQDSGGQPRFHSLLDLLQAGQACIGAVCFSLPELCDDETQVDCVKELRLQLDTFASRGSATPLLLVGTRKGEVAGGLEVQKELSALLDRELNGCPAYGNLVRNDKEELAFFGVENSAGIDGDATIRALIAAIESTARALPSMNLRVPPGWIAVYDQLSKLSSAQPPRPHLSRAELLEVAGRCGLPHMPAKVSLEREVDVMLGFLHALGAVLWFDLPKLRELVVCDPQWLIDGVSRVVRDFEIHSFDVDKVAVREAGREWRELSRNGMLHHKLLKCLWSEPKYKGQQPALLELMEHFSFLVRIPGDEVKYIVPALLTQPIAPQSLLGSDTCSLVLHFELAHLCSSKRNLVVKQVELNEGFLPQGLIHHLLGSAVGWTYHTTENFEPRVGLGSAHVSFGSQQLILENVHPRPFIRCTLIGISESSVGGAYPVCNRLRLLTDQVMQRFPFLRYRMLLPLPSARDIRIDQHQLAAAGNVAVYVHGQPWNMDKVKEELRAWLHPPTPPSLYDCFFSYSHHSAFDSPFIQRVHDATTVWCHVAFLDQYSLKPGEDLAYACMLGIANSRLLVPLISWSSLRRLSVLTTDSECSFYLLELTLMVLLKELYERPVLPIFVGASNADGSPDASVDLFACRPPKAGTGDGLLNELDEATKKPVLDSRIVFDRMPTVTVRSVTEQIRRFFERQGKEVPSELANLTVSAVVNKLRGSTGVVTWKSSSSHSRSRKQHWGLEMRVAEEVHFAIEATPPELPKLKFAKPAHPGEQDKAFEQLARDIKEVKSYVKEVKSDVKEVRSDVKEVKSDVKVVLHLSEAHFKLLSTLLKGTDRLAPKLICFLPTKFKEKGKLLDLLRHPKGWLSQRVRVFFVDPISLALANTNGGDGFELVFPKEWVAKALPYVKVGLTVLKVAAVAGKLTGFPAIPDLKAVMGEWVDSQLEAVSELRSLGLQKIEEMMGDRQFAEDLLGKVEEQCVEMLTDKLDEARMSKGNELGKMLQEPLQKSLRELDNLLKQQYPCWKDQCGLVLTAARDGSIEWILPEHVEEFTMKGALFRMGKSSQ